MRTALLVIAFAFSPAAGAHSISDEFAEGFGGVSWRMSFSDVVRQFPGGYQVFSTSPGGVAYVVNIEDPVLGISREGQYVVFQAAADGSLMDIDIQIPFEQAESLIRVISDRFGPVIGPKAVGLAKVYSWPIDGNFSMTVRTTHVARSGLATLSIMKVSRRSSSPSNTGDSRGPQTSNGSVRR